MKNGIEVDDKTMKAFAEIAKKHGIEDKVGL